MTNHVMTKKQPRSMRGVPIDLEKMRNSNQAVVALNGFGGNIRMNSRGDVLGSGGKVSITREQISKNYYDKNPNGVKQVSLKSISEDSFETVAQALERAKKERETAAFAALNAQKNQQVSDEPIETNESSDQKKPRKLVDKGI